MRRRQAGHIDLHLNTADYKWLPREQKYLIYTGSKSVVIEMIVIVQMKATEQYFPVVLFIMLYKMVLTFEPINEILKCDHSNDQCFAVALFILLHKVILTLKVWI